MGKKQIYFLSIILVLMMFFITSCDNDYDKKNYITGVDFEETIYKLKKEGYRIDNLKSDNILKSCQPNNSYGNTFTDRIQLYSDEFGKTSAIRIESTTDGNNISTNEDAQQHYFWIGSLLSYPKNIKKWITDNFNKDKSSIMLDKYTKMIIYAPNKYTRRMDVFKINDTNKESPIKDDELLGY